MNKSSMRILVLEPHPTYGGGSEAVSLELSEELARRGHAIVLLHDRPGSMLPRYQAIATDVVTRDLPGFARRKPLDTIASVTRLGAAARAARADVILSSHLGFIRHAALVRAVHGIPSCFHLGLPCVGKSADLRMAYRQIGAGVAPSAHTRDDWLTGGWPASTLHVTPNWVDTDRFAPSAERVRLRAELGIPAEDSCVLYLGRLSRDKGVEVLLEAFARLDPALGSVRLLLTGQAEPDYTARLDERIASLTLPSGRHIERRPATTRPEAYFAAADLACVPSVEPESFGLTVIEAMSSGVPVIASAVGVIPEILGRDNRDLLVIAGDVQSLVDRLGSWLADPVRLATRGLLLRERVLVHYTARRSVDAYESALAGLAFG